MFTALASVFLCAGGILPLATYACPVLASVSVLLVGEECGKKYGWCCYAAASLLALILSPDKEAAMTFAFLGYYPLIKPLLDRLPAAALRFFAKLAVCAAAMGAMYALLIFVFRLEAVLRELSETGPVLLSATIALGAVTFFVYDLALARLTAAYRMRRGKAHR